MQNLAALLKAAAWPLVALLFIMLFRAPVANLIGVFAAKIDRAKRVKLKWSKAAFDLLEEVTHQLVAPAQASAAATMEEFERLAAAYENARGQVPERMRLATE